MEKIKSYTDLEQSKKLAKILPIESADMTWCYNNSIKGVNYTNQSFANLRPVKEVIEVLDQTLSRWDKHWELIPCWSLSALFKVIPKHIKDIPNHIKSVNVLRIDIDEKDFSIWYDEIGYGVNTVLPDITMEEPVDACVGVILELHELNLL